MTDKRTLLVVAGDPSGDLHAAGLVRALKRRDPALRVAAIGGGHLREVADEFLFDLASLGMQGFLEPLRKGLMWSRLLHQVRDLLSSGRISAVCCVDFYGFNHQVLGMAKHRKIPTFYYISPQVWASRPGRVRKLARLVRHMMLIFPFEVDIYKKAGVPCTFVGHPLLDIVPAPEARRQAPFKADAPLSVGLLPGSRPGEISRHLPLLLDAFARIRKAYPNARARLFAAANLEDKVFTSALNGRGDVELVRDPDYKLRRDLDVALTCSGTATLENALLGVPMVVLYRTFWPTYLIAKMVVRVKYIALANILLDKPLLPELIQSAATPVRVAEETLALLGDPGRYNGMRDELLGLRASLGEPGAGDRAAGVLLEELAA